MWKLSYKHVKAISFPPQSPWGQRGLCYEIWEIMLWRQATLCWRFCGRVGVLKKQMNPEINVKENCGIPQQITQLQVALLLQTCQMGSDAVSLEESLFISFKQVIFITDIETPSGILYLCELKDDERIFLALSHWSRQLTTVVLLCGFFSIIATDGTSDYWIALVFVFVFSLMLLMLLLFILFLSVIHCFFFLYVSSYIYEL